MMKARTVLLIGFAAAALHAQNNIPANINPNLLYGKGLDAYNKGGPLTFDDVKDFYRDGGEQAVKQAPVIQKEDAYSRRANGNEQALADLRHLLNRSPAPNGARLPDMPALAPTPFASPIPSRSAKPADITQSSNPLDMLTVQDQAISPAFRYPGAPSMKSPEISKGYNFFSGRTAQPAGGSGSAFGLGASRPRPAAPPGSGFGDRSATSLRSSASVIASERAASFSAGGSEAAAAPKGASKK